MANEEKRAAIKWLLEKGKTAKEIYIELIDLKGEDYTSMANVYKWVREFKCGRTTVQNLSHPGQSKFEITQDNVDRVSKLVMSNRRLCVRNIAEMLRLSKSTVHRILTDYLSLKKYSARWVPRMLTGDQKLYRVEASELILEIMRHDLDLFLSRYVTVDETWIRHFDPESKQQSMQWLQPGEPPPKKFKIGPSRGKVMATVFWDAKGILLCDYLVDQKTITGEYYANLIRKLRVAIREKRRGMLRRSVLLHQDNAPVHKSRIAMNAIATAGFEILIHPPYSPDMAPSDYHLFPKLKSYLRGRQFSCDSEAISSTNAWFEAQSEEMFKSGVLLLEKRCQKCINVDGDYIEK